MIRRAFSRAGTNMMKSGFTRYPSHHLLRSLTSIRWKSLLRAHRSLQRFRRYVLAICHQDLARSFRKWQVLTRKIIFRGHSIRRTIALTIRRWNRVLISGFTKWKLFLHSERDKERHSFALCKYFTNHRNHLLLRQVFQTWKENVLTPLHLFGEATFRSLDENLFPVCRSSFEPFCAMEQCSLKSILADSIANLQYLLPEYRIDIYPVEDILWRETIPATPANQNSSHHLGYIPFDYTSLKSTTPSLKPTSPAIFATSGPFSLHESSQHVSPAIPYSPIYPHTPMHTSHPSNLSTSTSSPISPPLTRRKYFSHSQSFQSKQHAVDIQSILASTHHQGHYVAIRQTVTESDPSTSERSSSGVDSSVVLIVLPLIYQNTLYALLALQPWSSESPSLAYFSPTHRSPITYTEVMSHHMKQMLSACSTRFLQYIPLSIQMYYLFKDISFPFNHAISFAIHVYSLCQRIHLFKENFETRSVRIQASQEETEQVIALRKDIEDKTQRVEHLERSRLRHYKQSRKLKEVTIYFQSWLLYW